MKTAHIFSFIAVLGCFLGALEARAQAPDTLFISTTQVVHLRFGSELKYVNLGNKAIVAKIVDGSKVCIGRYPHAVLVIVLQQAQRHALAAGKFLVPHKHTAERPLGALILHGRILKVVVKGGDNPVRGANGRKVDGLWGGRFFRSRSRLLLASSQYISNHFGPLSVVF